MMDKFQQKEEARIVVESLFPTRKAKINHILSLRYGGKSLEEIAILHGISVARVCQLLKGHGSTVSQSPMRKARRKECEDKVKSLLEQDMSVADIAANLKVSTSYVYKIRGLLAQSGEISPHNENESKIDIVVARRLREAGATYRTIAAHFDVCVAAIQKVLSTK